MSLTSYQAAPPCNEEGKTCERVFRLSTCFSKKAEPDLRDANFAVQESYHGL